MDVVYPLYQSFVLLIILTRVSINGTSINTPTVVAKATGLPIPYSAIAIATANSKKLLAPTMDAGAAMFCGILSSFADRYAMVNTNAICIVNGIAISIMSCGFVIMRFPWNENMNISVNSSPIVVMLSNFFINTFSR